MENQEQNLEALSRARSSPSWSNYPAIFAGFMARGIPEDQIKPRENVFTYKAWRALGKTVKRGEHGVRVTTWITSKGRIEKEGEEGKGFRFPRSAVVFHESQVHEEQSLYGEVISSYSRAQAIEDGVLVDVSELAREAGFKFPVAVSAGVFGVLAPWEGSPVSGSPDLGVDLSKPAAGQPLYGSGQSFNGRAWDMLQIMLWEVRKGQGGDRIDFAPLFLMPRRGGRPVGVKMYSRCGPGDQGEPVITVMLPNED